MSRSTVTTSLIVAALLALAGAALALMPGGRNRAATAEVIPASQGGPGASNDGRNRAVSIINETDRPIWHIKATRKGARYFGRHDWLGKAAIAPGQSAMVNFDDGSSACLFDMRFQFASGEPLIRMGVDVCRISELRIAAD